MYAAAIILLVLLLKLHIYRRFLCSDREQMNLAQLLLSSGLHFFAIHFCFMYEIRNPTIHSCFQNKYIAI